MESDPGGVFWQIQNFKKMPRNWFSFAVFIGREPDFVGFFNGFFQRANDFGVFWINFIGHVEGGFVDFGVFSDVSNRGEHLKIIAQIFFNSLCLSRRLDDD